MKIATSKIKEALAIVKPALANKEILEQTTSFAFLNGRVVTYNDEISISHPFESDFEGAVKAEELYGLLSRTTKEEVSLVSIFFPAPLRNFVYFNFYLFLYLLVRSYFLPFFTIFS